MTRSKFLKVSCPRCNHLHTIFWKASTDVKCEKCNILLVHTKGGKARIKAQVKEVI